MVANSIGTSMLKELIKLSNELDRKGLTKEADALDSIIKEASIKDKIEKVWNWIKPFKGPEECSRRTAMAMVSLDPWERQNFRGCTRKDYEFSPEANKVDIIKALDKLAGEQTKYYVEPIIEEYMRQLAKRGMLTGDMIKGDSSFFEALIENSPAGTISGIVTNLIAGGANMAGQIVGQKERKINNIFEQAGAYTSKRGK